ncbi:MAG: phosphoglycerate dehydrogenase [Deltaproteobacteria bacterium]
MPDQKRVLVSDDLSEDGIAVLRKATELHVDVKIGLKPEELLAIIGDYDALAVRSATKVTAQLFEAAKRLKVVGRAGVGVDNVDLAAASRRGVVVMNTPGGSSVTVAELTLAMMFSLARQIPAATASVKSGKWEKKKFAAGHELSGKTLGVVGTGNIGSVVVERARAMRMKALAFDPYISAEAAARMGVELVSLDELLRRSDFVTLHVPLTDGTKNLIGEKQLAQMKKGACLVNCARGGIIDELALARALESGHLGGAALDVFEKEPPAADHPLFRQQSFVATPHLGASTEEAQAAVALALAEQLVDFLVRGEVKNAVNLPSVSRESMELLGPHLALAERLGAIVGQLAPPHMNEFRVTLAGAVAELPRRPIALAALRGLLSSVAEGPVNDVSAPAIAKERGIELVEERSAEAKDFASLVTVTARGPGGEASASGTLFGRKEPRLVRLDQFEVEAVPEGVLLILRNEDVPGAIGQIGQCLGSARLNIARMALSRRTAQKEALAILNLDSPASADVIEALRALPPIRDVKQLRL